MVGLLSLPTGGTTYLGGGPACLSFKPSRVLWLRQLTDLRRRRIDNQGAAMA
ncbi:MAG: hypothetical protein C207_04520, partial [Bradyrhizobium sp. DFCI-1]